MFPVERIKAVRGMYSKNSESVLSVFLGEVKEQGIDPSWDVAEYGHTFERLYNSWEELNYRIFLKKEAGMEYPVLNDVFQMTSAGVIQKR